ncbi:MAG TPA: rRNA maturation RNase YbeY [Allosphingosinicella sp.]|nr:rRNA maturation RNase YbeY [Allosphingosinicella sp.]
MMLVEAEVSEEWDSRTDWAALADRSVRAAVACSRHSGLASAEVEVSLKFTSDAEVRSLNATWRGKDRATNVLSFPMAEEGELADAHLLGDIVLASGVCAAEAAEKGVPMETHAAHLVVHGTLHLLGYDHETGEDEAEAMEEVERRALAAIGIADPYLVTEVQSLNG